MVRVFYLLLTPSLLTPFLLTPLLLTPFLTSCSSDDAGYQSHLKELLMEDMSFTCEGGTQEQVYRHEDLSVYKVSNKESWCTSTLDVNNCKLVVSVKANNTYDARTDTVTLTDTISKSSRYLTVKQARNSGLFLDKTYAEASMYGDTISAKLKYNVTYEVLIPDTCNWVTRVQTSKTRGLDSTTITFCVKENKTYKDRDAVITVFNEDEKLTDKLKIHQPFKTEFKADSTNFEVDQYGDTITVNLTTNISYDVTIPDTCSWISKKSSSGVRGQAALTRGTDTKTLIFFIKENKSYHDRDGVVTLSNKDAGASIVINIHQPFKAVFSPDKKYVEASQYGDTVTIKMTSNISYDVTIPDGCDWISRAATRKTRGVESSSILLRVAENTTYKAREAVIKVGNEEAGVSESITISQPFNMVFSVDSTSHEVSMDGATFTVNLRHNIGYEVSIPSDCNWLSQVTGTRKATSRRLPLQSRRGRGGLTRGSSKGIDTTAIVFRASENTTEKERETTITLRNKDAGAEAKVYVHQPFTTTFNVDSTSFEVSTGGGTKTVNVESNISYNVSIPSDCDWITLQSNSRARTRSSKTAALLFKISKNTTGKERSATVTIGNSSLNVSKAISFKQKFESTFNVDTTAVEVDELGGTFDVNVVANVSISVQPQVSWLTVGSKTDVGDGYWTQKINVLSFSNKTDQRQGKVKFLYAAGNESKSVTVTQKRTLYIKESDVTLTKVGKDSALTFTNTEGRNVSWSSSNKKVVTVNAGKVRAVADGKATITVKSSDGKYSDTCNITVEIEEEPAEEETEEETKDDSKDKSSDDSKDKSSDDSKDESADGSKDNSGSDKSSGARTRSRIRR